MPSSPAIAEMKDQVTNLQENQAQFIGQLKSLTQDQAIDSESKSNLLVQVASDYESIKQQQQSFVEQYKGSTDISSGLVDAVNLQQVKIDLVEGVNKEIDDSVKSLSKQSNSIETQAEYDLASKRLKVINDSIEIEFGADFKKILIGGSFSDVMLHGGLPMLQGAEVEQSKITESEKTTLKTQEQITKIVSKVSKMNMKLKEYELSQIEDPRADKAVILEAEIGKLKKQHGVAKTMLGKIKHALGEES